MHNGSVNCRVFISCGQHSADEKRVAGDIYNLLQARGFSPYLAIDVQTITEINAGIIGELKNSDCYIFVNFRRECLGKREDGSAEFRGSLFSNQELAIAYAFGFEKILIVNQDGVKPEGMLRYIGINTETFRDYHECLDVVTRALDRARWMPDYSRRLSAGGLRFSTGVLTYGTLVGWFLYLDVHNHRPDVAAMETTARLIAYGQKGKGLEASIIRSPLKATGRPGFKHTIFPKSHEAFDLLCIGIDQKPKPGSTIVAAVPAATGQVLGMIGPNCHVYLNSAYDVQWECPLPVTTGHWNFRFEIIAIGFPVMTVDVEVEVPGKLSKTAPTARIISQRLS
jgi:hypothetical protein